MKLSSVVSSSQSVIELTRAIIRYRYLVLIVSLCASLALAAGLSRIGFSTDYRVFFGAGNPHLKAYNDLQAAYQKEDGILLVLAPKGKNVFTPDILTAIRGLTEAAWQLPFATRVDSITNFQHSEAKGDDIVVEPLAPRSGPIDAERAATIQQVALNEPALAGRLVAHDQADTGVNVTLTLPGRNTGEIPQAMAATRKLVDAFRAAHPDIRVAITGSVALNNAFVEAAQKDNQGLFPVVYGIIFLVLLAIFPSVAALVGMVAVVALSTAAAVGIAGWKGMLLNPVSAAAPLIITTVATADVIHLLTSINSRLRQGSTKEEAIVESLDINFFAISLTSLTTVIGFLSLNTSDAPPFHDLGNIAALGVIIAWLLSITLLPVILYMLPPVRSHLLDRFRYFEKGFTSYVIGYPRMVLAATVFVAAGLIACIPRTEVNDQFVNYFSRDIAFRADTDFAAQTLTGIYQLDFSVDAGGPGAIADPNYLAGLQRFTNWLREQPEVTHVSALPDTMNRLNMNMHGDDAAHYRLPQSRELAAQYLLLFEMSLPQGQDLRNQINIDRSASRVVATLKNVTTRETQALKARAEAWLRANMPTAKNAQATGPAVMFSYIYETNIRSMLSGTAIALLLISACLMMLLKNLRLGLISLLPNVLPVLMTFGLWGLLIGRVGLAAAVVAAVTLGLVVDNTVHFLSKYQWARRRSGVSPEAGVRSAYVIVGPALVSSTAILLAGFLPGERRSGTADGDHHLFRAADGYFHAAGPADRLRPARRGITCRKESRGRINHVTPSFRNFRPSGRRFPCDARQRICHGRCDEKRACHRRRGGQARRGIRRCAGRSPDAPEGFQRPHERPGDEDLDAGGHGPRRRRQDAGRIQRTARYRRNDPAELFPFHRKRRPVAVSAGAEAGQADLLLQQVGSFRRQRVRL